MTQPKKLECIYCTVFIRKARHIQYSYVKRQAEDEPRRKDTWRGEEQQRGGGGGGEGSEGQEGRHMAGHRPRLYGGKSSQRKTSRPEARAWALSTCCSVCSRMLYRQFKMYGYTFKQKYKYWLYCIDKITFETS